MDHFRFLADILDHFHDVGNLREALLHLLHEREVISSDPFHRLGHLLRDVLTENGALAADAGELRGTARGLGVL